MKLNVSLAQIYPRLGDLNYNIVKHIEIIQGVRGRSQLLIFPELSLTGSNLMDLAIDVAQTKDSNLLRPVLEACRDIDIIIGLVELGEDGNLYDSAFYCSNSSIIYIQRKLLSTLYIGRPKYFIGGSRIDIINTKWGNLGVIIGDDIINPTIIFPFVRAGTKMLVVISNDISFGYSSSGTGISKNSVDLMNLLTTYARLYSLYIFYVNRVGFEDGINFFGGSCGISPSGEILTSCSYFEEAVINLELDLETFKSNSTLVDFDKVFKLVKDNAYEY